MTPTLVLLTSLAAGLLATWTVRRMARRLQIGALPGARKMHQTFIPVLGGLGVLGGLLAGMAVAALLADDPVALWRDSWHFWAGLAVITVTGLVDDIRGISPTQKFLGQALAAAIAAVGGCMVEQFYSPSGLTLPLGYFSYPFSILWIMFVINAVNLLDGLDGLAGGISLITVAGFWILASLGDNLFLCLLTTALAGGLIGFLVYNYHPASIFMGDVGSLSLGYLLACLSIETLKIAGSHQVFFLASLVMVGMPLTDTLIAFFRRMGRGDHPFKPDREHIHHRLIRLGVSHLDTVWVMYYGTLVFVAFGVLMVVYRELAGVLLFLGALGFAIFWAWRLGYVETRRPITFGLGERETHAPDMRPMIHVSRLWHQIALMLGDLLALNVALYLTFWFRFQSGVVNPLAIRSLQDYLTEPVFLFFSGGWMLLFAVNNLYRMAWDVSRFDQVARVTRVTAFGILVMLVVLNLDILMGNASRAAFNEEQMTTLGFYGLAIVVAVNGIRLLVIAVEKRFGLFEYATKNTLVIGATRKARNLLRDIHDNPHLLYRVVGIVARKSKVETFEGLPVLGDYDDLRDRIVTHQITEILVAIPETAREDLLNIIGVCDRLQVVVKTLPELQSIVSGNTPRLAGHALIRIFPEPMVFWQWAAKRVIDVSAALAALATLLPLWLPVGGAVRLRYGAPPLVRVPILGRNGQVFNMLVFRLHRDNGRAEPTLEHLRHRHDLDRFAELLFRTSVYKLPLLVNLLRGDMTLVGPRPEPLEWYRQNQHKLRFLHRRLLVRPGVSGLAQVKFRFDASQQALNERIKFDIVYVENMSLSLDVRIMLRSVLLLFRGRR